MKHVYLLVLITALFTFSSCDKDKKTDPAPIVNPPADPNMDPAAIQLSTQLLTGTNWQLVSLTQGVPGNAVKNDIYNTTFAACQKDDVYKFTAAKTITVEEGFEKCGTTTQTKTGTWNLKSAVALTITVASQAQTGLTGDFTITELTNSKMVLKQTVNGNEYVATYTPEVKLTKTQILTGKNWKITNIIFSENNGPTTNYYDSLQTCERDNLMIFAADGSLIEDEGLTKCDPNDPQNYTTTWTFINNETGLKLYGYYEVEILTLTPAELSFKYETTIFGKTYTEIYTYKRI